MIEMYSVRGICLSSQSGTLGSPRGLSGSETTFVSTRIIRTGSVARASNSRAISSSTPPRDCPSAVSAAPTPNLRRREPPRLESPGFPLPCCGRGRERVVSARDEFLRRQISDGHRSHSNKLLGLGGIAIIVETLISQSTRPNNPKVADDCSLMGCRSQPASGRRDLILPQRQARPETEGRPRQSRTLRRLHFAELARAQARIAELQRKIGRQQIYLYFFREPLRLIDAPGPSSHASPSTRSSKK